MKGPWLDEKLEVSFDLMLIVLKVQKRSAAKATTWENNEIVKVAFKRVGKGTEITSL